MDKPNSRIAVGRPAVAIEAVACEQRFSGVGVGYQMVFETIRLVFVKMVITKGAAVNGLVPRVPDPTPKNE